MPNPVVHFEIGGADGSALQQFYAQAFDWEVNADNPMQYGLVEPQTETSIGGGITAADQPGVFVYIEVDDLQAYLDRIESLGGRTVQEITTIPGMVTMALFADPEGNVVGIVHNETPPAE
ncbi:MAG: VOC family protein [Chloroflexi bacterium]|nr:VOC family protein [Chloroflexota bacterium]